MFKVTRDGKEFELKAVKPNLAQKAESDKIRNRTVREAVDSGAYLKSEIPGVLKSRGEWNDEKDAEVKNLTTKIEEGVKRLNEGGFDLDEAEKLAYKISEYRGKILDMMQIYSDMSNLTAEGKADNKAFDYLVSQCVVYNSDGKPFFASFEDFLENREEDYCSISSNEFYKTISRANNDSIGNLPEYKFLKEYGFLDDKLRKINENGQLVDDNGKVIDEDGYYLNDEGKRTDKYGNLLDEENKPIIERKPFTRGGKVVKPVTKKETEEAVIEKPKKTKKTVEKPENVLEE